MRVKEKLPYLISGVVIFIIVIIFSILYFTEKRKKEERELYQKMMAELERKRQMEKEELERKLEELERKRQEEELRRQMEEEARKMRLKNAYKEIEIVDFNWTTTLGGGITLNWIMLHNPTDYTFDWVEYEFYDANDNVVRIKAKIGPLFPNQTKKFYIDKWVEGLWEHRYGIRIVDGKATE